MGNIFLCVILGVLTINIFSLNYQIGGVNRTLFNLPISLFESSIPLLEEQDNHQIYFDKTILKEKLTSYFDKNLTKYVDKYTVEYYYYKQSNNSICTSNACNAVKITVNANLFFLTKYQRSASFYIRNNTNG